MENKISRQDGAILLKLARQSIDEAFVMAGNRFDSQGSDEGVQILNEKRGVFVTLHHKGQLRGCIGNIEPVKTVYRAIVDNARHAAFDDTRFSPVTPEEIKGIHIEVSILTKPEKLVYADAADLLKKLRPMTDGVIIQKKASSATFLPQVWHQLRDPASFLSHLCTKAGLSGDEWKLGNLKVFVYQVQSFEEEKG